MLTRSYGGTRVTFGAVSSGVVTVTADGPLTAGMVDALRNDTRRIITDEGGRACVLDLRRALILLDGAQLTPKLAPTAPSVPLAIIVRSDKLPMFRAHALRMAKMCLLRGVFSDAEVEAAFRWAREKVPLTPAPRSRIQASAKWLHGPSSFCPRP